MNDVQELPNQLAVVSAGRPHVFRLENVRQTFGERGGIEVDALSINRGKVTAIIGRSGSGKSTLLHLLGGMLSAEPLLAAKLTAYVLTPEGERRDQDLLSRGWRGAEAAVGFVFQQPYLMRDASAALNMHMSLATAGLRAVGPALERLWQSLGFSDASMSTVAKALSGGMQQRLAVGRAIARNPTVILADEPTANLDPALGRLILNQLASYTRRSADRSLIIVSHDLNLVHQFANEVVVLEAKPGSQIGYLSPRAKWPIPMPKSLEELSALLGDDPPTPAGSAIGEDLEVVPTSFLMQVGLWCRLGFATVFNRKTPRPAAGQNNDRVIAFVIRHVLTFIGLVVAGVWLVSLFEPAVPRGVGPAFLVVSILLLLPRALSRLSLSSYFRAIAIALLVLTGLVATAAIDLVKVASEHHLTSPDLRMLLAARARHPLTIDFVNKLQKDLKARAPADATKATMFGRHILVQVRSYSPPQALSAEAPACDDDEKRIKKLSVGGQGLTAGDPLMRYLRWRPVPYEGAVTVGDRVAGKPAVSALPELEGNANGGNLYAAYDFLARDLELLPSDPMPKWLCLDIRGIGSYAPFRISAVVDGIPDFDLQKFAYLLNSDAAAAGVSSKGVDNPSAVGFSAIAVEIPRDTRREVLQYLKDHDDNGDFKLEVGFAKLDSAVKAASIAVWLARGFCLLVLALSTVVATVLTLQFIENNRRELAVVSAFGASMWHLLCLTSTILLVPLGIALAIAVAATALVLPQLFLLVGIRFGIPVLDASALWQSLASVAVAAVCIIFVVAFLSLALWKKATGPVATQLQDVA